LTRDDDAMAEDDFPVLLQVNLHAFLECLSMFHVSSTFSHRFEVQRSVFHPIKGTLRFVYEGDGEPFLVMYGLPAGVNIDGSSEENGVVMTSELTTYAPDEDEDSDEIAFSPASLVSKVIMKV
jgi:Repair protein Rad1/Rec1/Rad17